MDQNWDLLFKLSINLIVNLNNQSPAKPPGRIWNDVTAEFAYVIYAVMHGVLKQTVLAVNITFKMMNLAKRFSLSYKFDTHCFGEIF